MQGLGNPLSIWLLEATSCQAAFPFQQLLCGFGSIDSGGCTKRPEKGVQGHWPSERKGIEKVGGRVG
jgi:hypothetical protein